MLDFPSCIQGPRSSSLRSLASSGELLANLRQAFLLQCQLRCLIIASITLDMAGLFGIWWLFRKYGEVGKDAMKLGEQYMHDREA
jgi:hypothetical protein